MERILNTFWASAIAIWLAVGVTAAPPLTITDSGYYLTILDGAGVPTLSPVESVTDLRSSPGDPLPPIVTPPTEPKPPVPPDVTPNPNELDLAVVKSVMDWATAIDDPDGSQGVANVYDQVREAMNAGVVSESAVWSVLKAATDDALFITSENITWGPFRSKLSDLISEGRQRGKLTNQREIAKLLASVNDGLDLSADGKPMLSDEKKFLIAIKTNEAIDAR